jgi:hypothetical protein
MPSVLLQAPDSLTLWTAPDFARKLQALKPGGEYVLDFSRTKTVEPFGMLVIATELHHLVKTGVQISCAHLSHMTYAAHMGFFKAFGVDFGKEPGEALGTKNYVPIIFFNSEDLRDEAAARATDVGDVIEAHSRRLAAPLIGADEGDVFETMAYSIREIMRNVVEHAQVSRFAVCSQYWPTKGRAEVAIVDRGIGLRESLAPNPHIDASTDKKAINYALMPAVSGKAFKGARRSQKRGPWNNSGFGLYMTSRICRNGGNFYISTGDTGMLLTSGKDSKRYVNVSAPGTAVRMSIRTDKAGDLRASLAKFREDGFAIQQRYKEIVSIDPSSASLMLSEDFDLSLWDKMLLKVKGGSSAR